MIDAAKEVGLLRGVTVGKEKVVVTHLQYADDTLLVGAATDYEIGSMKAIM